MLARWTKMPAAPVETVDRGGCVQVGPTLAHLPDSPSSLATKARIHRYPPELGVTAIRATGLSAAPVTSRS